MYDENSHVNQKKNIFLKRYSIYTQIDIINMINLAELFIQLIHCLLTYTVFFKIQTFFIDI
jgi:hypothetical protein